MAARKKDKLINFIPSDKFASTMVGRLLSWLLSTFRIIVIVIEMIVMLAFLSRFWLDAKNSDLNDEIRQKQAQIAASKEIEEEFNTVKKRLAIFAGLAQDQSQNSEIIRKITYQIPPEIVLNNIGFITDSIAISGSSPSEQSIAQLIINLNSEEIFDKVNLMQLGINKDDENLLDFAINITVKKKQANTKGGST